ncbi:deaminase [Bacillus alkalisoli]|uniref:deaminase n=1 Tax=Bacillus alkalisoli TaxID=2011008 RepID=UPI000C23365C|nr:deaminase [Bacillus alkalisoli]
MKIKNHFFSNTFDTGFNRRETSQRSITHAEDLAIEEACEDIGSRRQEDTTLYVTLESCPIFARAIVQSRMILIILIFKDFFVVLSI